MAQPAWLVRLIRFFFPGRFLMARLTRLPLLKGLFDRWMFRGDRMFYLPRGGVIEINETLAHPTDIVLPYRIVEHFVRRSQYRWIMNTCICRESTHCREYPIDLGCLFMGDAVLGIRSDLGRLVSEGEASVHVRRCSEAGLVALVGRNKLDTLWLGIGPGDRLLTVCHCCPCCCLWRVLPHLHPSIGGRLTKLDGVTVRVEEGCNGCGECVQGVCFVNAIRMEGGRAVITDSCRGCGRCADRCPRNAIRLTIENEGCLESVIGRVSGLVEVT